MILLAAMALQAAEPAKLFVSWGNSTSFTGYPSFERCERARKALVAHYEASLAAARERARKEDRQLLVPTVVAYCLPG